VETLRLSLDKLGAEVYVIAPRYSGWNDNTSRVGRLPAIFSPFEKFKPIIWPVSGLNKSSIRSLKLDLVHSHFYYNYFGLAAKLASIANVPLVNTFYKLFPEHADTSAKYKKWLIKTINFAEKCNHLIALSRTSKKYLLGLGISRPIEVLPVGIFLKDYSSFPPDMVKEKFHIPRNRKIILYVGAVNEESNISFLLKSFKNIWHAIEDVHLLIIGGGEKLNEYKEIVRRQPFSKFVTFTGYLPKSQVNKIYAVADVFAYPAQLDPEPLVVLESISAGTPPVAVRGFGAQDFIKDNHNGFVTKLTIEDFSEKIIEILRRDKMRLEFSRRCRLDSLAFKAVNLSHDLLTFYEEVIEDYKNKFE